MVSQSYKGISWDGLADFIAQSYYQFKGESLNGRSISGISKEGFLHCFVAKSIQLIPDLFSPGRNPLLEKIYLSASSAEIESSGWNGNFPEKNYFVFEAVALSIDLIKIQASIAVLHTPIALK